MPHSSGYWKALRYRNIRRKKLGLPPIPTHEAANRPQYRVSKAELKKLRARSKREDAESS